MSDQELEMPKPEFQDSDGFDPKNRFAFVNLNNFSTATPISDQCTMCGGSTKRRSPSSSSLHDPTTTTAAADSEPKPKRIMVEDDHHLCGFSKISLPFTSPKPSGPSVTSTNNWVTSSYPILRRTSSDPFNSPVMTNNVGAPANPTLDSVIGSGSSSLNPQSPDNTFKINASAATTTPSPVRGSSSALPPLPPTIRRTVSDPTPSAYQTPVMAPGVARSFSRSSGLGEMDVGVQVPADSIKEESPNSKRLRRMKDRMREMSQWWDEVLREGEAGVSEDNNSNTTQDASGNDTEEEVSVERVGECLSIHFRCPCGKGYQILLSGRNCYYKLM